MAPSVAGSGQEEAQSGCQDSEKFESDEDNSIKIKALKAEGNRYYAACEYDFALNNYMNALELTDESMNHEKAVLQANVGQVYFKMNDHKSAIYHTSKAIDLEPTYLKAILRRANMYELNEDFEHAINDHELALKLDPNLQKSLQIIPVLKNKQAEKIEKMKNEMINSLKNIANPILNKFGLSTDNFKLDKNPETGGYSMRFER